MHIRLMMKDNAEPRDGAISGIYGGTIRGLGGKAAWIFEELERRLIYGTYKFGTIIPTVELLKEFNVSRAPLTAALNQLRFEGYIEVTPQVASRVISPTEQQIRDYFAMFALVEAQFARFAAMRRSDADVQQITGICDRLAQISARLDGPNETYIDVVDMYHMSIRQASRSPLEVLRLRGYFRFAAFLIMNGWPRDFRQVVESSNLNRPTVTKWIAKGDPDRAGQAMSDYILGGAAL